MRRPAAVRAYKRVRRVFDCLLANSTVTRARVEVAHCGTESSVRSAAVDKPRPVSTTMATPRGVMSRVTAAAAGARTLNVACTSIEIIRYYKVSRHNSFTCHAIDLQTGKLAFSDDGDFSGLTYSRFELHRRLTSSDMRVPRAIGNVSSLTNWTNSELHSVVFNLVFAFLFKLRKQN
jgi:hypothetical protein